MKNYVLNAFMETPWAILPQKLYALEDIVLRHVSGEKLNAEEIQAMINGAARPEERTAGNVAVLPLFGTIIPRAELMTEISGATSVEKFSQKFSALVNDPKVSAIVLDVNSPGGQIGGVQEMADKIFAARGTKPIIAVANHLAASAAYWIASAADELVVTPSGEVGSIGVFAAHTDKSKALDQDGVKMSLISAGRYKVEGNPYEPLSDSARASMQERVNGAYEEFINAVARNRKINMDQVRNGFGEGRTVTAKQAVEIGMADRVETLEETLTRLQTAQNGQAPVLKAGYTTHELSAMLAQARTDRQNLNVRLFSHFQLGGSMNQREKIQARADLLKRASDITELTDVEDRMMTEGERGEFEKCLANADGLLADITQHNGDREKLRAALEADLGAQVETSKAEKPDGKSASAKLMKRGEFEKLAPNEQANFVRSGGRLED